jgi:hypothetical protein
MVFLETGHAVEANGDIRESQSRNESNTVPLVETVVSDFVPEVGQCGLGELVVATFCLLQRKNVDV